jgi:uncharacterized membrane protein
MFLVAFLARTITEDVLEPASLLTTLTFSIGVKGVAITVMLGYASLLIQDLPNNTTEKSGIDKVSSVFFKGTLALLFLIMFSILFTMEILGLANPIEYMQENFSHALIWFILGLGISIFLSKKNRINKIAFS